MHTHEFQHVLGQFEQICKTAGLKVTQQRLEIYRELLESEDHPAAETLHKRLVKRMPTLSLDTVYRTLATLVKWNIVQRIETKESQARYEALASLHHHFLCDHCGKVIDFIWPAFDTIELPTALPGVGVVGRTSVVMHGRCTDCLAQSQNP